MKNAKLADLGEIFKAAKIEKILLNGALAYQLFMQKYAAIDIPHVKMPSTSPANPRFNPQIWEKELYEVFRIYR